MWAVALVRLSYFPAKQLIYCLDGVESRTDGDDKRTLMGGGCFERLRITELE